MSNKGWGKTRKDDQLTKGMEYKNQYANILSYKQIRKYSLRLSITHMWQNTIATVNSTCLTAWGCSM